MHTHVHVCAYACLHRNTHLLLNVHMYLHTQMCICAHTHTSWCTYEDQKTTLGKSVLSYCVDPGNQILVTRLGGKPLYLWDQLADPPWYYWFITIVVLGLGKWLRQWSAGKELRVVHAFELPVLERLETGESLRITGQPSQSTQWGPGWWETLTQKDKANEWFLMNDTPKLTSRLPCADTKKEHVPLKLFIDR